MKTYNTEAAARAAMNRQIEQGMKLGIIRKYRIRAWLDFRPADSNTGVVYTLERITDASNAK